MEDRVTYGVNISSPGWLEKELRYVDFKGKRIINRLIKPVTYLLVKHPAQKIKVAGPRKIYKEVTDHSVIIRLI